MLNLNWDYSELTTINSKEELQATHPTYDEFIDDWIFYRASYYGGSTYKNGDYLLQHPFESTENYQRRKSISYFYNYCQPIVDIYTSYIFRREIVRDFGTLTDNEQLNSFLVDADLSGKSLDQFMKEAEKWASVYGQVHILVDSPSTEALTQADKNDLDLRPYTTLIQPQNLLDWEFEKAPNGKQELSFIKLAEAWDNGVSRVRVWTKDFWEVWEVTGEGDDESVAVVDGGDNKLGKIPLITVYNKQSDNPLIGISDITDIADINKNIYYLCSDAKEIIENTAFPMLAVAMDDNGEQTRETGPKNIMQFDSAETNAKPFWLEAPHSSLSEIRNWVTQDKDEIFRIAKMGGASGVESNSTAKSGLALEIERQQLDSALSEKADNIEEAENQVLRCFAEWEGKEFDGFSDYPDDFNVKDAIQELDQAMKAKSAQINSITFKKELEKKIVQSALPKLGDDKKAEIFEEIEVGIAPTTLSPTLATDLGVEEVTDGE